MKRKTLKEKRAATPAGPRGKSRYSRKVVAWRKLAARLGVDYAPLPVLRSAEVVEEEVGL